MNEKPKMKYRVITAHNPKTGGSLLRPVVTDRMSMTLKGLVEYAKTAGYVRGQTKDLEGLLGGFIQAMQDRAKAGYTINVNDWFIIGGRLKGTVGESHQLTDANSYHVTITASKDLKVGFNQFSWTNVDDVGESVKVSTLMSVGGKPGFIQKTKAIIVTGKNLSFDASLGDTVTVTWKEGDEEKSAALTPTESDYSHMKFDWPTALADVPVNTELTFSFRTRGGTEGAGEQLNTKSAKLTDAS